MKNTALHGKCRRLVQNLWNTVAPKRWMIAERPVGTKLQHWMLPSNTSAANSFPLPPELTIVVFAFLDLQTLLRCRQVCRLLHDLVDNTTALQYKIELAVAGMDDGQSSTVTIPTRLDLLKAHNDAWKRLAWKEEVTISTLKGCLWELSGGVLGLAADVLCTMLEFRQLPSLYRGIKEKRWSLRMGFQVADFAMDPHQDLLVVVEVLDAITHGGYSAYRIYFRSLSTGEDHPLTSATGALSQGARDSIASTYDIRIFSSLVGVLFMYDGCFQLVVWDWKKGIVKLQLSGDLLHTYCFLDNDLVMIGVHANDGPVLRVFSLSQDPGYLCDFRYPAFSKHSRLMDMTIHHTGSDPTSNTFLDIPFSKSKKDWLIVVSFRVHPRTGTSFLSFIPFSTIASRLGMLVQGESRHIFTWEQWGPMGTRIICQKSSLDWICDVHGMKFAIIGNKNMLQLYDFNNLFLKRYILQSNRLDKTEETITFLTGPSTFPRKYKVFEKPVATSLPCSITTASLPQHSAFEGKSTVKAVMLSSDSLIAVAPESEDTMFGILTF